ncbi:MAG: hypothetical protein ACI9WT_002207, partial [Flavobacterium sp.]
MKYFLLHPKNLCPKLRDYVFKKKVFDSFAIRKKPIKI